MTHAQSHNQATMTTGRAISSCLLLLWTAGYLGGVGDAFQPVCLSKEHVVSLAAAGGFGFGASTSSSSNRKSKGGKNERKEPPPTTPTTTTTSADLVAAYEATTRGRDLQSKGALNEAIASFSEALELHPTVDRQFQLALALEENGEPQRAIEMFEQAQRHDAADAILGHDVHLKLAHLWAHDLGDVQRGIGHVDQALAWST